MDPFVRHELTNLNRQLKRQLRRGRVDQAMATAQRIVAVVRSHLGNDHPMMAAALAALGDLCLDRNDLSGAEQNYCRAVAIARQTANRPHSLLQACLLKLARVKTRLGKQHEAAELLLLVQGAAEDDSSGNDTLQDGNVAFPRSEVREPPPTTQAAESDTIEIPLDDEAGDVADTGETQPAKQPTPLWPPVRRTSTAEALDTEGMGKHAELPPSSHDTETSSTRNVAEPTVLGRDAFSEASWQESDYANLYPVVPPAPKLPRRRLGRWLRDLLGEIGAFFRRRDLVESSVFAPPEVAPGSVVFVQVFVHRPDQRHQAQRLARQADRQSRFRGRRSLQTAVARGTKLGIHLVIPGWQIDQPHTVLVWRGEPEAVQFAVRVPAGCPVGTSVGTVLVSVAGVPVGHLKFTLIVVGRQVDRPVAAAEYAGEVAHRYRRAFVSYARADLPEVLKRVAALRAVGIRVAQDLLTLEPGARWERQLFRMIGQCELFLLFWSSAAKASEWVRKEVRYAQECHQGDERNLPEIVPMILEVPPPLPPPELAHLHFDDYLMYLTGTLSQNLAAAR